MENEKLIPFPVRLTREDFISEMFLLSRILSENLRIIGVNVKKCTIFMLCKKYNVANIEIEMGGNNAVVSIDATSTKVFVYYSYKNIKKSCFYDQFRESFFIDFINSAKD